ncbi:MAG: hypothetical protein WEF53_13825 [Bacteroidota bacterium]
MKPTAVSIAFLISVLLFSCKDSTVSPLPIEWVQTGLDSTSVGSFAVSGANLFAGTDHGVFLSTNNGLSWSQVNSGLTWTTPSTGETATASVQCLATLHAADGITLLAGTWGGGVYRSTNNGASWTQVNAGLTAASNLLDVRSLAISTNGAGGADFFAGTAGDGVFLSTDSGSSWTQVNAGLTANSVFSIFVKGTDIFLGTDQGVFLSTNGGRAWTQTDMDQGTVIAFALLGTNLCAGTYGGGVYLSTNNGTSWTPVDSGLTNVQVFCLISTDKDLFTGTETEGVFLSTNGGGLWTQFNSGLTSLQEATGTIRIFSLTVNEGYILAGSWRGGVWRRLL